MGWSQPIQEGLPILMHSEVPWGQRPSPHGQQRVPKSSILPCRNILQNSFIKKDPCWLEALGGWLWIPVTHSTEPCCWYWYCFLFFSFEQGHCSMSWIVNLSRWKYTQTKMQLWWLTHKDLFSFVLDIDSSMKSSKGTIFCFCIAIYTYAEEYIMTTRSPIITVKILCRKQNKQIDHIQKGKQSWVWFNNSPRIAEKDFPNYSLLLSFL